jgi:hypothetical protein
MAGAAGASGSATAGLLGAGNTLAVVTKTLVVSMLSAGALSAGVLAVQDPTLITQSISAATVSDESPESKVRDSASKSPALARGAVATSAHPAEPQASPSRARFADADQVPTSAGELSGRQALLAHEAMLAHQAMLAQKRRLQAGAAAAPRHGQWVGGAKAQPLPNAVSAQGEPLNESALGREVERIDSARRALESNDAPGALAELESYDRTRESGVLDREALLLRIEALTRQHKSEQAKALVRQYLQRFPGDSHAPRLRTLLANSSGSLGAFPRQ